MRGRIRSTLLGAGIAVVHSAATHAQSADSLPSPKPTVRGIVLARGAPVAGADVFDRSTLSGAPSGADGRFAIVLDSLPSVLRLSARHIGYKPLDTTITSPRDSIVITLEALAALTPMTVLAGRFTADVQRTATLTPLEVMTTPGGGDVNSAVKTLPGVASVDEGTGLFVRGGDYTETRTFIEGAPTFTAYQFAEPTGSVAGTINPFLTSSISLSSGGFGANWGNALSGVLDLQSQNRPENTSVSVNATLLSVGAGASVRLPRGFGAAATASANDLSVLLDVNGNPTQYRPPPHGNTLSGQAVWEYSATGRIKLFSLRQQTAMGMPVQDPVAPSTYLSRRINDVIVASWRDTVGAWRPFVDVSTSGLARGDSAGVLEERSRLRSWQAHAETGYVWTSRVNATAGVEAEDVDAASYNRFPLNGYDPVAGAPSRSSRFVRSGIREAVFAILDTRPFSSVELVTGLRGDKSDFSRGATADPRASVAWVPVAPLTLTASWGVYYQVADPSFLGQASSVTLPSLRADMRIAGAQLGEGSRFARVELWRKRYDDLVAFTRDYNAIDGLSGRASGLDLFARSPGPLGTRMRLTWSSSWSRRVDANSLQNAPAPFDITNSVTAVLERDWDSGWHVGVAQRFATGKPYTDVVSATYDSTHAVFVPAFGPAGASRLPDYRRADIAISRIAALSGGRFLVVFGAIQNPFDTVNLFGYTWTHDYSARVPVRSAINRTFFIGANLSRSRQP